MDPIKEAFYKVRQDMENLKQEIDSIKYELKETGQILSEVCEIVKSLQEKIIPTHTLINPTSQGNISTDSHLFKPLNAQNMHISIGNQGVPTDRQTNQQTDRHIENTLQNQKKTQIDNAAEFLDSLDNLKKEVRLKFKRLTEKELLVFSTLYNLIDEKGYSDYKDLAKKLNLTESSIRDYIGKLIKKEIPVEKIKLNNKNIQLKISENLKKIASLSTILHLREI